MLSEAMQLLYLLKNKKQILRLGSGWHSEGLGTARNVTFHSVSSTLNP